MSEGYPVVGFSTDRYLMLDSDNVLPSFLVRYCTKYAKFHKIGSVLITKTSEPWQLDLEGNRLGNFTTIFGKPLSWQEIMCHIENACRVGLVSKQFVELRKIYRIIDERVNPKNRMISYPVFYKYIPNGNSEGCWVYVNYWAYNRSLGSS